MKNKTAAKRVILAYLNAIEPKTLETLYDIYTLSDNSNNEVLLGHIKALKNIFENAIKEIEKGE